MYHSALYSVEEDILFLQSKEAQWATRFDAESALSMLHKMLPPASESALGESPDSHLGRSLSATSTVSGSQTQPRRLSFSRRKSGPAHLHWPVIPSVAFQYCRVIFNPGARLQPHHQFNTQMHCVLQHLSSTVWSGWGEGDLSEKWQWHTAAGAQRWSSPGLFSVQGSENSACQGQSGLLPACNFIL